MASTRRILLIAGLAATAAALIAPEFASAATRYVDVNTGNDQAGTNHCLSLATPCQTIGQAISASGTDPDTILVDDGTYLEADLTADSGKVLMGSDFEAGDSGATIVDPGSAPNPVISAMGGATVSGLTLRNDSARLVEVNGPATISGNAFDETSVGVSTPFLLILAGAGNPTISGNTFSKSSQSGVAIRSLSTGSPVIEGNLIESFNGGIDVMAGNPLITGNEIVEQTTAGTCDPCGGIYVRDAQASVIANYAHDPISATGGAVGLAESAGGAATSASFARNVIFGGHTGIRISQSGGAFGPITLFGDAIIGYTSVGILTQNGLETITATNLTIASSNPLVTADVALTGPSLALNSSIISNTGITTSGGSSCTISFSRGPVAVPGGSGCSDFQTTADPMLAGASDYHLLAGSPMIDAGDSAAPPGGSTDIDSDPRALDATPDCSSAARRDIGADEFVPTSPGLLDCIPPETTIGSKPRKKTRKRRATFTFASSEPGATFLCSYDGKPFVPCAGSFTTPKLKLGRHRFDVISTDTAGNRDQSAATFHWKIIRRRPG